MAQAQPLTAYCQKTSAVLAKTAALLTAGDQRWTVRTYAGTSHERLFSLIPELPLPAAVVCYAGSRGDDVPRRALNVGVLVAAFDVPAEDAQTTAVDLAYRAMELLDQQVDDHLLWQYRDDSAVDVAPEVSCFLVTFEVQDH